MFPAFNDIHSTWKQVLTCHESHWNRKLNVEHEDGAGIRPDERLNLIVQHWFRIIETIGLNVPGDWAITRENRLLHFIPSFNLFSARYFQFLPDILWQNFPHSTAIKNHYDSIFFLCASPVPMNNISCGIAIRGTNCTLHPPTAHN